MGLFDGVKRWFSNDNIERDFHVDSESHAHDSYVFPVSGYGYSINSLKLKSNTGDYYMYVSSETADSLLLYETTKEPAANDADKSLYGHEESHIFNENAVIRLQNVNVPPFSLEDFRKGKETWDFTVVNKGNPIVVDIGVIRELEIDFVVSKKFSGYEMKEAIGYALNNAEQAHNYAYYKNRLDELENDISPVVVPKKLEHNIETDKSGLLFVHDFSGNKESIGYAVLDKKEDALLVYCLDIGKETKQHFEKLAAKLEQEYDMRESRKNFKTEVTLPIALEDCIFIIENENGKLLKLEDDHNAFVASGVKDIIVGEDSIQVTFNRDSMDTDVVKEYNTWYQAHLDSLLKEQEEFLADIQREEMYRAMTDEIIIPSKLVNSDSFDMGEDPHGSISFVSLKKDKEFDVAFVSDWYRYADDCNCVDLDFANHICSEDVSSIDRDKEGNVHIKFYNYENKAFDPEWLAEYPHKMLGKSGKIHSLEDWIEHRHKFIDMVNEWMEREIKSIGIPMAEYKKYNGDMDKASKANNINFFKKLKRIQTKEAQVENEGNSR